VPQSRDFLCVPPQPQSWSQRFLGSPRTCFHRGLGLKHILGNQINEYNRYRSPEANARLVSIGKRSFEFEFSGTFCYTCGLYDYFDDLKILLEKVGLKTKISKVGETDEGFVVRFEIAEQPQLS